MCCDVSTTKAETSLLQEKKLTQRAQKDNPILLVGGTHTYITCFNDYMYISNTFVNQNKKVKRPNSIQRKIYFDACVTKPQSFRCLGSKEMEKNRKGDMC